ncbi:hypothetical protein CAPTEDRAFT_224353 [Capitella teleta]|uniref:SHSP domain-containing protein n=1 Tax=Capitella teleta TaxID=283909 RepID=R7TE46_CAPTE|nr:hypothetical protein CAPTEDRAFT_224353 [Capitella teleta]|eukprot:ELT89727.1 hypothetical protein CAPTEDRAFT_224353 [Capitella teleta]
MASFCRRNGQCEGGFMAQVDPRQIHDMFATVLTSILNAHAQHQHKGDWTRKVLIPSEFTVDEIDISVRGYKLKIIGNRDDDSFQVSINIPDDVNIDALSTKWLEVEHSVIITGPRKDLRSQVDSDHVKAQMEAWMEDAKEFLHEIVSHEEKSEATDSTREKSECHLDDAREVPKENKVTEPAVHRVEMDVRGFLPDEISVVAEGTKVTVTGYHVQQSGETGEDSEEQRMKRTVTFPERADLKKISWNVDRQSQVLEVLAPLM